MTDLLKPSFVIAFLMLLGAALLCWLGAFGLAHFELIFTGAHP